MSEILTTELKTSGSIARVPCLVCGYRYRPYYAYVVVKSHIDELTQNVGDICPRCLESGKDGMINRLRSTARFYTELVELFANMEDQYFLSPEVVERAGKEVEAEIIANMKAEGQIPEDWQPEKPVVGGDLPF